MTKGSSLNRKKNIEEGILKPHEGRKNKRVKVRVNTIDFASPVEFSQLCLTVEAKIITLSDIVLNICRGNI